MSNLYEFSDLIERVARKVLHEEGFNGVEPKVTLTRKFSGASVLLDIALDSRTCPDSKVRACSLLIDNYRHSSDVLGKAINILCDVAESDIDDSNSRIAAVDLIERENRINTEWRDDREAIVPVC